MTENTTAVSSRDRAGPSAETESIAPADRTMQRRAAGAVLVAGPVIYFLAEFIAAAAWTDPPYSYTYHFISNLGVHGPSELLGQYMYSPLAWVMNTGFFLFGITVFVGVALLRGLRGRRRWAVLVPAGLLAVGGVVLAFFPGSGEAANSGAGDLHGLGAMAGFIGGNALVILLGRMHRRVRLSPGIGRGLVIAGVAGLLSMVAFFADVTSGANVLIGLVERGVIYPFLIALGCAGAAIWRGSRDRRTS
jgi:hypothetical membrane protein